MNYTCAEQAKKAIKAYFADFWGNIANIYNNCDSECKGEVAHEIILLANRIKELISKK